MISSSINVVVYSMFASSVSHQDKIRQAKLTRYLRNQYKDCLHRREDRVSPLPTTFDRLHHQQSRTIPAAPERQPFPLKCTPHILEAVMKQSKLTRRKVSKLEGRRAMRNTTLLYYSRVCFFYFFIMNHIKIKMICARHVYYYYYYVRPRIAAAHRRNEKVRGREREREVGHFISIVMGFGTLWRHLYPKTCEFYP